MNININILNSSKLKDLEIKNPSSSLTFDRNAKKEMKSYEKEQKFFKEIFPKIFNNKIKKVSDNLRLDKKIKGISLSVQTYNKYMVKYQNLLKYPSNNYYSTEKIKNFISYKMIKNTNLNRNNLYSTLTDFSKDKFLTFNIDNNINNNNPILNHNKYISKTIYGNKNFWKYKFNENKKEEFDDNEILKYFIEGTFLSAPEKIKDLKINEKIFHPHILNKNDFDFYSDYLENLHKNENFTDSKSKVYEISFLDKSKLKFLLELKSICLIFEEFDINNINDNKDNNKKVTDNNNIKKNIQKIYLPFKYLPLFFLFSYSTLKVFINEIITYDIENNKFNIVINEKMENIIKKYCEYIKNKINMYTLEKNESVFKDIFYYQNEFHFNYIFPWIIYDNRNIDIKTKCFKLKIMIPTINFQPEENGIIFQKYANKWLIFELVKSKFILWDRYLLYSLFMTKKFRKTISYILNKKRNYISYEYTTKTVGPIIDDTMAKKKNFDFFVTKVLNSQNHYYYFTPFKATISSRYHGKYNINDTINLQLNDFKKIYKLSTHLGLIATFNKFLFYNKLTKKYYFSFKFLQDITPDFMLLLKKDSKSCIINKNYKQIFRYNGNEYHLIIRECLLCEKSINKNNFSELEYYQVPIDLLNFILENDINDNKIFSIFINISNKLINIKEIEEYKEFPMKKNNNNDCLSNKNKRKSISKNHSNDFLKKLDIIKNVDKKNNDISKLMMQNNSNGKIINSNRIFSINKKISGFNIKNKKEFKKQKTILLGRNNNDKPKKDNNNKAINNLLINKNNIDNKDKEKEFENKELSKINYKTQSEPMRIKRDIRFSNYDNEIVSLKFNLNNNK